MQSENVAMLKYQIVHMLSLSMYHLCLAANLLQKWAAMVVKVYLLHI